MKKTAFFVTFLLLTLNIYAQESNTEKSERKLEVIIKPKIGFGELKLIDFANINGFNTAVDLMLSSKISEKYNLEYGLGYSEFKANNISQATISNIKSENIHIPVNIIKTMHLNSEHSIQIGAGLYGNYLYKMKMNNLLNEKNIGLNFGYSIQIGAKFKISNESYFRIMLESQSDFTNFEKNNVEFRQINTNSLALSFIHKF